MGMRYAIWNNKGGVGKSFLSFVLASEYARSHPEQTIIVVDMCPQANLSEIFLGGNGGGAKYLSELIGEKRTIGSYINSRIKSPHQLTTKEREFFIHVHDYNPEIPRKIFLVVGDPKLEIQAQVINQISSQTLPEDSWKSVHSWLLDLLLVGEKHYGNTVMFIDCNPSFSAYTELSLLAATHLIVPCSSDGSSARAIDNLSALVYGHKLSEELKSASFSEKCKYFKMQRPIIHSVLLNRSTQYDKKAGKAFRAMFAEIKKRIDSFRRERGEFFYDKFDDYDIPDAHSPAIACSHKGVPIGQLKPGKYEVHDSHPQVNEKPLTRYRESIQQLVDSL